MPDSRKKPRRTTTDLIYRLTVVFGFGLALVLYINAAPVTPVVLIAVGPWSLWLVHRLDQSLLLVIVLGATFTLGCWESWDSSDSDPLFDMTPSYASTLMKLYPDRPKSIYERAIQAFACRYDAEIHAAPACREVRGMTAEQIDQMFRKAVSLEPNSYEDEAAFGLRILANEIAR